jgi:CheY-like chemotaxis protein
MSDSPLSVLIVEDSLDDLFILKRAFRLAGTPNEFHHVENGQQAIDYLAGIGPYSDRSAYPLPSLVLLDLKLPVKHGLEVLEWIKKQPSCQGIIVVILTSSSEDKDVSRAYDLGANAFLVKPTSAEKLTEIVRALDVFWLRHNKYRLPSYKVG